MPFAPVTHENKHVVRFGSIMLDHNKKVSASTVTYRRFSSCPLFTPHSNMHFLCVRQVSESDFKLR